MVFEPGQTMNALPKDLAELPTTWEQPTILSEPAKRQFMSKFCAVRAGLRWSPNSAPLEYQDDPFHHAYLFIYDWASDSVVRLRTTFMELVKSEHGRVDVHSINETVRQIKGLVGFLASEAIDALKFARKMAPAIAQVNNLSPKRVAGQIVALLDLHLVLWTDEFRAWAERLRPVHEVSVTDDVVLPNIPGEPESNHQENEVPVAAKGSHVTHQPAWKRLLLKESKTGDNWASLDGETYRVGEPAFKMLAKLQKKEGERVKCTELQREIGAQPSVIYKDLPEPLKAILDMPGKKGRGVSMR